MEKDYADNDDDFIYTFTYFKIFQFFITVYCLYFLFLLTYYDNERETNNSMIVS